MRTMAMMAGLVGLATWGCPASAAQGGAIAAAPAGKVVPRPDGAEARLGADVLRVSAPRGPRSRSGSGWSRT